MHPMKLKHHVAALAVAGVAVTALAATAVAANGNSRSAETRSDVAAMKQEQKAAKAVAAAVAASDVGDADSFGRNAKWIGLMSSGVIQLTDFADDCLPANFQGGPDDHCVVLDAQPATTAFDFPDIARTDAQATKFFTKDTIITMGVSGSAQGVVFSSLVNNVRWMGD
jgi:hypothetical protein